jgi:hypothetical protein
VSGSGLLGAGPIPADASLSLLRGLRGNENWWGSARPPIYRGMAAPPVSGRAPGRRSETAGYLRVGIKTAHVANFIHYTGSMFVRWQKRTNQYCDRPGFACDADTHLAASLIESVRIDGKPRQRHVAYLAGISEKGVEHVGRRLRFWREVDERLHDLSNRLTAAERKRITAIVAARVPRPSEAEAVRCDREFAESIARIRSLLREAPARTTRR